MVDKEEFIISADRILKEIESVEYYMNITKKSIMQLINEHAGKFNSTLLEFEQLSKSVITYINKATLRLESLNGDKKTLERESYSLIESKKKILETLNLTIDQIKHGALYIIPGAEGIPLNSIRNSSIFVYLFSIYEVFLKNNSTQRRKKNIKIKQVIENYSKRDRHEWSEWGKKADEFRELRNKIVHEDVKTEIVNDDILDLINNIKVFISLYSQSLTK